MAQRYDTYKDSGVQWLGEIPGHWEMSKVSSHFKQRNEKVSDKDYPALSVSKQGVTPQLENVALSNAEGSSRKLVKVGDYAVNSRSDRKGSCGVSKYEGSVSLITIVLEPLNIDGDYVHYLFRSNPWIEEFYRNGRGIVADLWTTNYQMMKSMYMPLPPLSEQHSIVSYLDDKCGKIDKMLEGKQKQIELLAEMKQRIIADAVTRGLNPDVKMKATNIPWLPEIPEHWEMESLRRFLKIFAEKGHGDKQLLSVTREQGVIERNTDSKEENHNFIPEDLSGYKYVQVGDFVINKMKSWQGSYGVSEYEGIVSPAYFTCKLQGVDKDFFSTAIRSKIYVSFFARNSKGIRVDQWDLSPIALKSIPFALPPLDEQHAIVSYITKKTAKIDTLTSKLQQEIESIKEYKQRLISDVVTGQIKVC